MGTTAPPLIPPSFYFRISLPCPRVDGIPKSGKGRLLGLADACALPAIGTLDGRAPWAEVRVAWNPGGIGLSVEVRDKPGRIQHVPGHPEESDGIQFWIDTRDTRDIHRASRYCHRFHAAVLPSEGSARELAVAVRSLKIARATADAPEVAPETVRSKAERTRSGYRLELFLPGSALLGFDPETNRRLGFCYRVTDPDRGDQFLSVGREFPVGENPSLWANLELIDAS